MTIGTRVIHKRYPWMVGTVKDTHTGYVFVHWEQDGTFPSRTQAELVEDLRPTPVQPNHDRAAFRSRCWQAMV